MRTIKQIMGDMDSTEFSLAITNYKTFCEKVLGLEVMPFHMEWIKMVQNNRRVAISAATGSGKTEILARAFCIYTAYMEKDKEMCIVSKTLPQARKVLSEIKDRIENNELLQELIPKDKPRSNWSSADKMELSTGCKIYVRPYSENIKGIHVDYLLGDEVSSYDDVTIWYRFVVTRTNAKDGKVVAISTPDNIADLMEELLNNPQYAGKDYPMVIDGKSIWPTRFSMDKLDKIKSEIGVSAFEVEYLCNPRAQTENALYPPHLIVECFDIQSGFTQKPLPGHTVIGCDFAIASGPRADYDAYVVLNKFGGKMTILHGESHRGFSIAAKVDRLRTLYDRYRFRTTDSKVSANIKFVVDPSNVGEAVLEELKTHGLPVEPAKFDPHSRNKMLINLRRMIENKDLIIPRNKDDPLCMTFTDKLIKEMISMIETQTKSKVLTYRTKAPHDDTVFALAMAASSATRTREFLDIMEY